ncbi:AAA family ATPase [Arthrobacter sp. GMC3]|uniref:AAA family ATPase n=1 Tax=Arthrobacter sp. GMC3 TaxID=2058894 RepID=UPI0015E2F8A8|nr:ATP-binding protein [Arthrobacter sp. GMC3]
MSTKITKATLTNFQKVSFAEIVPSGNLIVLAGKNESGKTSTLDGLQAAICGHNSRDIKRPIRDGHGKGAIEIELSDGSTLLRGYTPSGSTLKGKDAAGVKFGQSDIDSRLSSLGIDGRKFISLGAKEQLAALLSIVDLPFVPAELDAQRKKIEVARLLVGQQGKAIGDVAVDPSLPLEETSAGDLIAAIRAAEDAKRAVLAAEAAARNAAGNVSDIKTKIAALTADLATWEAEMKESSAALDATERPADPAPLEAQLAGVEETNATIRANNAAIQQAKRKDSLRDEYAALTADIEAIDKRKKDGLAAAVMPIEGLDFDDEGVLYQGVPFSRASGAKQLIVSAAMIMATNPELRVIVIRDGNVLDMDNLALLDAMAEATNFQVFIEIVAPTADTHEYFFTDGELNK